MKFDVDTVPICFTRFTLDVPSSAIVVYGRMTLDSEIVRLAGEGSKLMELATEDAEKKRNTRASYKGSAFRGSDTIEALIGRVIDTRLPNLKHVVGMVGYKLYSVDSFLKLGNDIFLLQVGGQPESFIQKTIAEQEDIAASLRLRAMGDVPKEEGACIEGAFSPLSPTFENIQLGIRFADNPDVHLSIELIKNRDYVEPVEDFQKGLARQLQFAIEDGFSEWVSKLKYLRRGEREVNGWSGYEVLAHLPNFRAEKESHQFLFHSSGKKNDPFSPQVDIRLDTGVLENKTRAIQPSLTDEAAVALWDKLLASIRVRSTTQPQSAEPALGLTLSEGELAPVDGWWECLSVNGYPPEIEVKGGKVQYFPKRGALPRVTLSRPSSFWQRLTGQDQTFQPSEKSSWRLVEIDRREH